MSLSPAEIEIESRKQRAQSLFLDLGPRLEAMRDALEDGQPKDALEEREQALAQLCELATLLGPAPLPEPRECPPLTSPALAGADLESLQTFRRAAGNDLELLHIHYAGLCAGQWRTGADTARSRAVRRASLRWAVTLGICAALLAAWWGWQFERQENARAELDRAKSLTATQAVRFISMTAWLAQKTQGQPLSALATGMAQDCSSIDLRQTLPNHPCREAWAANRASLFKGAIPAPGHPLDAPSEIFSDPWGAPYILLIPQQGAPRIVSAGPDGRLGTLDDLGADIPYWGLGADGGRERQ